MTELQLILLILAGTALLFQLTLLGMAIGASAAGRNVRVGFSWGLAAAALLIVVVLL